MIQTLTHNVWLYSIIGAGAGLLVNLAGCRLLRWRRASGAYPFDTSIAGAGTSSRLTRQVGLATHGMQRLRFWMAVAAGAAFGMLWLRYGPSVHTLIVSAYFSTFLLIFALDLIYRWVPNVLLLPAAIFALAVSALTGHPSFGNTLLGGVTGFVWFCLIALASRGGLGAGDVKLAGLIGLITGFPGVLVALSIGILAGGVIAALLLLTGQTTRKSYIPYAPFLITGAIVMLVFGDQISARLIS